MRSVILAFLLVLAAPVHAALVDNGSFTSDTVSGLDWLDLDQTTGLSLNNAEASQSGWRLATNADVENIFSQLFDGFYQNIPDGIDGTSNSTVNQSLYPVYLGHNEDALLFTALFGYTNLQTSFNRTLAYGYYIDENGIGRMMGAMADLDDGAGVIFGPDYGDSFALDESSSARGVFMVRTTAVPVPAAVWLFGSGLAALGWLRRRTTS